MRKKKTLLFFGSFVALLLLVFTFLPSFFSTQVGKPILLSLINRHLPGALDIQTLSLSWIGPQEIHGLTYTEKDKNLQVSCARISCSSGLWQCFFSSDLGSLVVQAPKIEIHPPHIYPAFPAKPQIQAASLIGSVPVSDLLPHLNIIKTCDIEIQQGQISIFSDKTPSILLDALTSDISIQKKSLFLKIQGNSSQKNLHGTFAVESNWVLDSSLEVKATLSHFPIEGADALLSRTAPQYRGYLTEAIGPFLDLQCHVKIAQEECIASLQMQSAHIKGFIQTQLQDDIVTLSSPASLQLSLSSGFLQKLQKTSPTFQEIPLHTPLVLSVSLDQLQIPKEGTNICINQASFEGKIQTNPYAISDLTIGWKGNFSSQAFSEEVLTRVELQVQQKKELVSSFADIHFKHPLGPSRQIEASFQLAKTPTHFLQNLFPQAALAKDMLGRHIEAEGSWQGQNISLSFRSEFLQIPQIHLMREENVISLKDPAQIQYLINPDALTYFLSPATASLKSPSTAKVTLSSLQYVSSQEVKMQAQISASPLLFSKFFSLESYEIHNLKCQLDMQSLSKITMKATSDPFDLDFEGGVDLSHHTLFWEKPIKVRYALTEQILKFAYTGKRYPRLVQNTPMYVQIDPANVSWRQPSLDQMQYTAHLQVPTLSLQNPSDKEAIVIQNLLGTFEFLGLQNMVKASLSSQVNEGTVSCEATVGKALSSSPDIKTRVQVEKFPLKLVNMAFPSLEPLTPLIGSSLDATIQIAANSQSKTCQIESKSPLLQVTGGVTIDSQGIYLTQAKSPLQLEFQLTPQAYAVLTKNSNRPFYLEKNALINASISQLSVPFLSATDPTLDLKNLVMQMKIENPEICFKHKDTKKSLQLQNSQLVLQKKDAKTPLTLRLDTSAEGSEKGSLHIDAVCKQLLNPQGQFHLSHMECDIHASLETFPSSVLDIAFPLTHKQKDPFFHLLGPSFNLLVTGSLKDTNGQVVLQMKSPNVQISLDGAIKKGTLLLNKNMWAQCAITPETSKVLLQEVNPLSISSVSSSTPLTLEIASQGFAFPLSPFALQSVQIPQGRITLGKLFCHNEGNLHLALGLLKSQQIRQNERLELWFAPLDFHIQDGMLQVDRTEILIAGLYDVALWGQISLPQDRVHMNLGLTASCLKAALNIQDLPSDYVLHIPLTGTLSNVQLNKKVATSKIVALTLWQNKELAGAAAGGGWGGALVGGLLNQVVAPPGNDSPTPPARHPFPWESSR